MNKPAHSARATKTREAICLALAEVIAASPNGDFSVQEVADRAGVTHRTVYNHFPNRQSLVDGLNAFQESRGAPADLDGVTPGMLDGALNADGITTVIPPLYQWAAHDEALSRAVAGLSLTSPRLSDRTQSRTEQLSSALAEALPAATDEELYQIAVAVRVFASQVGWHLLTGPFGLGQDDAEQTAAWATRVLIDAAKSGNTPTSQATTDPAEGTTE